LKELEDKKAVMEAQIAKTRAMLKKQERSRDTRRKIVAGAILLEHGELNPAFGAEIDKILRTHVSRPQDRELFDFPPLPDQEPSTGEPANISDGGSILDVARQNFGPGHG
jgi:large subunit ribosomal protein L7/L12